MEKLETEFVSRGWRFEQFCRTDKAAIYRRFRQNRSCEHYEVISIRLHDSHIWPTGKVTPAGESYPSATQWGVLGWTFSPATHQDPAKAAKAKYDSIA